MRDSLLLYVNGRRNEIRGSKAFATLAEFLRRDERATGTKIVCEEGDCGACTVLVGRPHRGGIAYQPINSCIQFLFQLDCTHVVTVEGLSRDGLTPLQESMVAWHGAQCGYCTPGFIMAMAAQVESGGFPSATAVRDGLTGNLCRCTGYDPIIRAALETDASRSRRIDDLYPPAAMLADLVESDRIPVRIDAGDRVVFRPASIEDAIGFRAEHRDSVIVQGGTDVGVLANKRGFAPRALMTLDGVPGLDELRIDDGMLLAGGRVTIGELKVLADERIPEFGRILEWFGAPQIRNAGTLAGNIANASPIADTVPFLLVMEAKLELTSARGTRTVDITSFYKSYKVVDMAPDEIITRVLVPLSAADEDLRLYRVSKRRHLDIASVTAAFLMRRTNGAIDSIRIAYGGVAPVVLRLPKTEAFLRGKPFMPGSFEAAGELACQEIRPISDVRGSASFRSLLARNLLRKLYYETAADEFRAKAS